MHIIVYLFLTTWGSCWGTGTYTTWGTGSYKPTNDKTDARNASYICGSANPNKNVIDLRVPTYPGPFRDLTATEIRKLRTFMENDPNIRASSPASATVSSSFILSAELLLPPKAEVLRYLDYGGPTPVRRARVAVFRGDKTPPVVEELVCQPLPNVRSCELLDLTSQRNPVEFNFRPGSAPEFGAFYQYIAAEVDRRVGYILKESYGETFTRCEKATQCLTAVQSSIGSAFTQDPGKRYIWAQAHYNLPFVTLHPLDFSVLTDAGGSDPTKWTVVQIWYANQLFQNFEELIDGYNNSRINKTRISKPANDDSLFSSLHRRGEFQPPHPQRPPTLVEPDGKRYSVRDRQVSYLDWTFNFRMSPITGPALNDIRFKGQRIAYQISLSEVAVFYSGFSPYSQTSNFVDSAVLMGATAASLVLGADCPDTATLLGTAFMSQTKSDPDVHKASFCLFEHNNGVPLRRHLSYSFESGSFYGGMMDNVLVLRTILAVNNYDYVFDFMFHQNGVLETRVLSTGYITSVFYTTDERPYGFKIHDHVLGHVHHHMFSFRVDLDINGTSNRYQTLDLQQEQATMTAFPNKPFSQTKFKANLKRTELEALHKYNFDSPKYHVVHKAADKNSQGEIKSYRIKIDGISKNLMAEGVGNEKIIAWSRHQMAVTKYKDDEISSGSIYGLFDSFRPVVDFTTFYTDNETIVDEDLVLWVTCGVHHIPHSEDIPVTATAGSHMSFALIPFNYFPECPSMGSRDAIYADHINPEHPEEGVKINRHGNSRAQCLVPKPTLEEDVAADPDIVLQSRKK